MSVQKGVADSSSVLDNASDGAPVPAVSSAPLDDVHPSPSVSSASVPAPVQPVIQSKVCVTYFFEDLLALLNLVLAIHWKRSNAVGKPNRDNHL